MMLTGFYKSNCPSDEYCSQSAFYYYLTLLKKLKTKSLHILKSVSLLLALMVISRGVVGQDDFRATVIPPAPTSAIFNKYGNDQPSLQTGIINIPISLFTVGVKGINIPLALTYQTSGINITDNPYPVGYGWTFSPVLRITRTILGRPDEQFPFKQLDGSEEYNSIKPGIVSDQLYSQHQLNYNDLFDTQKDVFSLHLPSKTINFFIKKSGNTIETITTGNQVKITAFPGLAGFKVLDEDGVVYLFGNDESNSLQNCTEPAPYAGSTAWMLREIRSLNNEKIFFSWQKVNTNAYAMETNTPISVIDYKSWNCDNTRYDINDPGGMINYGSYSGANVITFIAKAAGRK
ncbi:hypothetical protein LL912_03675 [Niabella sp. CC-SYL272]|uniref:hypothetical protein n=1 Tax=Niabella agricola TaxID=2891571 RepID=UPI001F487416|nr:hypothetical protein [Niabella agricola]MCF3107870.1 hypothetical protein [Niabella agricola]